MILTAAQAKERILSGNIEGNHEVMENLHMDHCFIPIWPQWKFQEVTLRLAEIRRIGGTFKSIDCSGSTLKEIDPSIRVDKNKAGASAYFTSCQKLTKVQGNFRGLTNWSESGITEIDPKTWFGKDNDGMSAIFEQCRELKTAQGNFPGSTIWHKSGIIEIDAKTSFGVDASGISADFVGCKNLITFAARPKGVILGNVSFHNAPPMNLDF